MANPRYPQPQAREKSSKLDQLMPLIGLQQNQQQDDDSASNHRLSVILQMLGLQQNQQEHTAQQGYQSQHLKLLQDQLGLSREENAIKTRGLDASIADRAADNTRQTQHDILGVLPQTIPGQKPSPLTSNYLRNISPEFRGAEKNAQIDEDAAKAAKFRELIPGWHSGMPTPGLSPQAGGFMQGTAEGTGAAIAPEEGVPPAIGKFLLNLGTAGASSNISNIGEFLTRLLHP